MTAKSKYGRLVSNTAIIALGSLGSKVLVYLLTRFYTSVLSPDQFGIASNVTETATLLIPLISLGIAEAIFRFALDKNYSKTETMTTGVSAFMFGTLLFFIFVPLLCSVDYFNGYVWLIVVYVLCSVLHSICSQFLRAVAHFKLYALQGIINTLLTIIFNLIFLLPFKMGVVGYILSVAIADLFTSLFIIIVDKLYNYIDFSSFSSKLMGRMLKYSIPLIPTTIFWWITNVCDRYMVTYFLGDAVNGLYSAAYKIPTLLIVLSGIFIDAWKYSALAEEGGQARSAFFSKVFESFSSIMFMGASAIITFTPLVSFIMLAPSYRSAWIYIPILAISLVYADLVTFMSSIYMVSKKSLLSFYTSFAGAIINVVLNFILIPTKLGALGAAIATFASYFVVFLLRAANSKKVLPFNLHTKKLVVNTAILAMQTLAISTRVSGWFVICLALLVFMMAINLMPIVRGVVQVLKRRR